MTDRSGVFFLFIFMPLIFLMSACGLERKYSFELMSPDGDISLLFRLDSNKKPSWNLYYLNNQVLDHAPLGLVLQGQPDLYDNMSLLKVDYDSASSKYDIVAGASDSASYQYNAMVVTMKELIKPYRELIVKFRAYNEGVAFRYMVKNKMGDTLYIKSEKTAFPFAGLPECTFIKLDSYLTSYEELYTQTDLASLQQGQLIGMPAGVKSEDGWTALLTEAGLKDYSGMYLLRDSLDNNKFNTALAPFPEQQFAVMRTDSLVKSPWRVMMLADDYSGFFNNNLVMHLNEPSVIQDDSWIKPGKSAWDWWSGQYVSGRWFEGEMDNQTMKYYIDFAADMDFEYMMIDADWYGDFKDPEADITTSIEAIDIQELIRYAEDKNVGIWLWVNWQNLNRQMDEALPLYQKWGVKGIKVDYMDADHQPMVAFYHRLCKSAAKHQLMLNLHGAYKPTGIRRTYPNLMTREGVLGMEYLKWDTIPKPRHNVTLPFIRMQVGPMDYTPGGFFNVRDDQFKPGNKPPQVLGSRTHHLAMFVVFLSPLQMVADHPGAYRDELGADFIRKVPATWDESLLLQGEMGHYIVMARRKGTKWFIGGMTDEQRSIQLPLHFLVADSTYQCDMFLDNQWTERNPESLSLRSKMVNSLDTLTLEMANAGGFAIVIE